MASGRKSAAKGKRKRPSSWLPRGRTLVSLLLLYLSVGFLLTFTMRWPQISTARGRADFLEVALNPQLYLSAVSWPFWLISTLV